MPLDKVVPFMVSVHSNDYKASDKLGGPRQRQNLAAEMACSERSGKRPHPALRHERSTAVYNSARICQCPNQPQTEVRSSHARLGR